MKAKQVVKATAPGGIPSSWGVLAFFSEQLQACPTLHSHRARYRTEHVDWRGAMKSEGEGCSTLLPSHGSTVVGVAFSQCQLHLASLGSQNEGSRSL